MGNRRLRIVRMFTVLAFTAAACSGHSQPQGMSAVTDRSIVVRSIDDRSDAIVRLSTETSRSIPCVASSVKRLSVAQIEEIAQHVRDITIWLDDSELRAYASLSECPFDGFQPTSSQPRRCTSVGAGTTPITFVFLDSCDGQPTSDSASLTPRSSPSPNATS